MDAYKMAELGQPDRIELICKMLKEADDTKIALRRAGYGWTGLGLLDTVRQILDEEE